MLCPQAMGERTTVTGKGLRYIFLIPRPRWQGIWKNVLSLLIGHLLNLEKVLSMQALGSFLDGISILGKKKIVHQSKLYTLLRWEKYLFQHTKFYWENECWEMIIH